MVGYTTIDKMAPVFSLVCHRDRNEDLSLSYPELYEELTRVRTLPRLCTISLLLPRISYKTLFIAEKESQPQPSASGPRHSQPS
jgi:hypothetical protein